MNQEEQLKVQALLDGELPEREARETLSWTQRDSAAAGLLAELKNTRQALAQSGPRGGLPESREFFWSKIEREIQRLEPRLTPRPKASLAAVLRRWVLPVAAVGLAIAAYFHGRTAPVEALMDAGAPVVETMLADADATIYRDVREGTTLVWFSPAAGSDSARNPKPNAVN